MAAAERKIPVSLTVVPLEGWDRGRWYDETGLPWVNPSPNIRSVTQALLYSGVGLARGDEPLGGARDETPFEVVGAPWIEPDRPGRGAESAAAAAGCASSPIWFTPTATYTLACRAAASARRHRPRGVRPVTVALALARALRARHREQFRPENIQNLLVNRSTMWAFLRGEPLDRRPGLGRDRPRELPEPPRVVSHDI